MRVHYFAHDESFLKKKVAVQMKAEMCVQLRSGDDARIISIII